MEFGITLEGLDTKGYCWQLVQALVAAAHDPDTAVAGWMRFGWPLGILNKIVYCNVFPQVDEDTASVEASKVFAKIARNPDVDHSNYSSFYEAGPEAEEDLARVVEKGFAKQAAAGAREQRVRWRDEEP